MNEVEEKLRRALRPIDPPEGFAERVLRQLPPRHAPATVTPIAVARTARAATSPTRWRRISTPTALAASLLIAVLAGRHVADERAAAEQRAGLEASRELMQALRVTSQKLDLAYEAVQRPAPRSADEEENRS
jgi:hypothetical protein